MEKKWPSELFEELQEEWKDSVFLKQQTFIQLNQFGLIVISPVLLSSSPEGALGGFTPDVANLIDYQLSENVLQYIYDRQGELIYSNNPNAAKTISEFNASKTNYFVYESSWKNYKVFSFI